MIKKFFLAATLLITALAVACSGGETRPTDTPTTITEAEYSSALQHYKLGLVLGREGSWQEAIAEYDKAVQIDPQNAQAYSMRGVAYENLGQSQKAIVDYDEAIRIDPQIAVAYGSRAISYKNIGQLQKALQDYDEAIRLVPEASFAYVSRAIIHTLLGNNIEAQRDVDRAVELGLGRGMVNRLIEDSKGR